MKRLHVHVAVENLPQSIGFYSALFAAQPAVVKTDYAKWMLDDPRVNPQSRRGAARPASITSVFRLRTPTNSRRFMRGSIRPAAISSSKVKPPAVTRNRRNPGLMILLVSPGKPFSLPARAPPMAMAPVNAMPGCRTKSKARVAFRKPHRSPPPDAQL